MPSPPPATPVILGLNCSGFHSSACLLTPTGQVRVAIAEERLTRVKQDKSFPRRAIAYCCAAAGISVNDLTDVFVGWNPAPYLLHPRQNLPEALLDRGKLAQLALNEMAALQGDVARIEQQLTSLSGSQLRIQYVNHHQAHLANAWLSSGFEEADFLVADGFGETTTGLLGTITRQGRQELAANRTPHSLGLFYATFTQYLGFRPNSDEWKVMALAARGNPAVHYDAIRSLIQVENLHYELDLRYFEFFLSFTPLYYSPKLLALLGPARQPETPLTQHHYDVVAAVQRVTEEVVFALLRALHAHTGQTRLVLGGGVLMNSVLNGKLRQHTPYQELFIGGTPDDTGISVGSALHGYRYALGLPLAASVPAQHNFFGREYAVAELEAELRRRKVSYERPADIAAATAALLHSGHIVGWFQGGSELGQRALGHRSILANPTLPEMKERVNASIKYREAFRPFAPAVPEERQHEFFELPAGETAYFMEKVFPLRPAARLALPAVAHDDGTGRLQSVRADHNAGFHRLLLQFEHLSGVPVLLNTSFNLNGMPLVETPADALDCYFQSGLDALALGPFLLRKQ
ncbi:carbamoyltransferase family protein [Hymenobacter actinosclerus]|uniref:Carbamoyltransferase n=1 Tax=Hymenobacter actinosclerus TaxID=82805 RepID=A0A1I0H4E5_9BACT|nr:carbamoyltransferase C-terminal domain-containing protein [Hymenobacter actinosclerus]SET78399.1 carbamoyltransferase [Hymenobacter actinosclerus]